MSNEQLKDEGYLSIFNNSIKLYSRSTVYDIQINQINPDIYYYVDLSK